jgi:Holliday junction DNA helicase RuvA
VIARLAGTVAEKEADAAIVDVGGVGYRVMLSQGSLARLPAVGGRVQLRTYTHVREDALALFGFATAEEEAVFQALIGVTQVGPKAALHILSGIEAQELALAVAQGDVARLTRVPGVGKKTAERLVVELKEKVSGLARAASPKRPVLPGVLEQLEQALLGLGFKPQQAAASVEDLRAEAAGKTAEALLKEALKRMRSA